MRCYKCGIENRNDALFCVNCGNRLDEGQQVGAANSVQRSILELLKDKLFLVICILFSVGYGLPILYGNFNVIGILVIVFLWLLFSEVKKDALSSKNLRCLSGVTSAVYIVVWVAVGFLVLAGIGTIALSGMVDWAAVYSNIYFNVSLPQRFYSIFEHADAYIWIAGVSTIFIAVVATLLNIFCYKKLHSFAQSLYKRVEDGVTPIVMASAARSWLIVLGVFAGLRCIATLGIGVFSALSSGCSAVALIMASSLIKKYIGEDSAM